MGRRIAETLEETAECEQPAGEVSGTTFIKNVNVSELLKLEDGLTFVFGKSSVNVTDEKIIAGLQKLADKPGNPHFILTQ